MKTTVIDATQLIQIEYKGQRVLTVKQLTALYGCGKDYIAHRFGDNKEFFTEGVHYFKLEGANLVEFRKNFYRSISSLENADENSNCENSQLEAALKLIPLKGRHLVLWTKRGTARLCKMINTENAWKIFDLLENAYFDKIFDAPAEPTPPQNVFVAPPPPPIKEVPETELSRREKIDILRECLNFTDSKNLRNRLISDIAKLVTNKNY